MTALTASLPLAQAAAPWQRARAMTQAAAPSATAALPARLAEHEPHLRAVAMRLCKSPADAADLVQDAFERALRALDKLDPDSNPRAWLVTILHNLFIDRCRGRKREPARVALEDAPAPALAAPDPEAAAPEPAWARLGPEDLRRAVARLDEGFRVVYTMHALEGRPYEEIATVLGIPKATVGTRLARAREKLRRLLAEGGAP